MYEKLGNLLICLLKKGSSNPVKPNLIITSPIEFSRVDIQPFNEQRVGLHSVTFQEVAGSKSIEGEQLRNIKKNHSGIIFRYIYLPPAPLLPLLLCLSHKSRIIPVLCSDRFEFDNPEEVYRCVVFLGV